MRCPKCHTDNREGARFCLDCGSELNAVCPACGVAVPNGARFCDACGAVLPPTLPEESAERSEDARSRPAATDSEYKQVTILFADLAGSTQLIEGIDAEDSAAILEPCLNAMTTSVERHDGIVVRKMGDGILALFGAPVALEDHAIQACHAALELQAAIEKIGRSVGLPNGGVLKARIGLNSGAVLFQTKGDGIDLDHEAIGLPVHLAARMEQSAAPGTIHITGQTLALTRGIFQVESLGAIQVKGISEPVPAYRLLAVHSDRPPFASIGAPGSPRLIGRDREMAILKHAFDRAARGDGQIVAAVGEPGIGKSRLFQEFAQSQRLKSALVLACGGISIRKDTPWAPIAELIRQYFAVSDEDPAESIIGRLSSRVTAFDGSFESLLPALCALLGVQNDHSGWEDLEPNQRRWRIQHAVKTILLRECAERPVVIIFEDLHWADETSLALIGALVESLTSARLLLLVNYRLEFRHDWANLAAYSQIRIQPLEYDQTSELLDELLGRDPSLDRLKDMIAEQVQGNALFLTESVRALAEAGHLAGEPGAYRLHGDLGTLELPRTVQSLIAARIDRLAKDDKRLLCTAAVIGQEFQQSLLSDVVGQSTDLVDAGLSRLRTAELIFDKQFFPEAIHAFKHAIVHDAVLQSLLKRQRRDLHGKVASAMASRYSDRRPDLAETIAMHFASGAVWDQAAQHYLRAADWAKSQYAIARSEQLCDRLLECVSKASGLSSFQFAALSLLGDLWSQRDELEKANEFYRRALESAPDADARVQVSNKLHRPDFAIREGAKIGFYRHGTTGKTIVLSSPISYSIGAWQPIIDRLCQEFKLITIDSRGVGASGPITPNWDSFDDLEDVRAVIEKINEGPVTLVGLSRAGSMAVAFAAKYPALVERIVAIGAGFGKSHSADDAAGYLAWANEKKAQLDRGDYHGALREVVLEAWPEPELRELSGRFVSRFVETAPQEVFRAFLGIESEIACEPFACQVSVPALVIHGTEDKSVPYHHGMYVASLIPNAVFYPFVGRGHEPQFTATAEFCNVLREFVAIGRVTLPVSSVGTLLSTGTDQNKRVASQRDATTPGNDAQSWWMRFE